MTMHASEEIAEDALGIVDVETSILNSKLVKSEKDDPRGPRHTVHEAGPDRKGQIRNRWPVHRNWSLPPHHCI